MPGAEWFPGARLNYAGHILARERPDATAIISVREGEPLRRMSWATLGDQVRILATQMPLFVKLRGGRLLDEPLTRRLGEQLRPDYSPPHVPAKIYQVLDIPYTLT